MAQIEPITKLEVLYQLWNEQIDQLTRMEVDFDFWTFQGIADPDNKENITQKHNLQIALPKKRKLVAIIQKMIDEELGKNKKIGRASCRERV